MPSQEVSWVLTARDNATQVFNQFDSVLQKIGLSSGPNATKAILGIGAAAVGITYGLFKIGEEFDTAFDKIRTGTGETGRVLRGLQDDFKNVVASVPTDFDTASTAITDLNVRLGLTGKPLQEISQRMIELTRVTETDLATNITDITRLFGDWSVKTEDQSGTLDKLFRATQETGVGLNQLSQQVVFFGAPLRQLGFSFDESITLLSKWAQEGVNVETVLGGLRQSMGRLIDPTAQIIKKLEEFPGLAEKFTAADNIADRFRLVKDRILELIATGDPTAKLQAGSLALEIFGRRAGGDMVAAFAEGRFAYGDLLDKIASGTDTVNKAAEDTYDFAEQWQLFKNRVLVTLEPIATRVFKAIGDAMEFLNTPAGAVVLKVTLLVAAFIGLVAAAVKVVGAIKGIGLLLQTNPIIAIATAIALVAILVITHWEELSAFFSRMWPQIKAIFEDGWNWLKDNWRTVMTVILTIIAGPLGLLVGLFISNFNAIKDFVLGIATWLLDHWRYVMVVLLTIIAGPLGLLVGLFIANFTTIKDFVISVVQAIWDFIQTVWNAIVAFFTTVLNTIATIITTQFNIYRTIIETTLNIISAIIGAVMGGIAAAIEAVLAFVRGVWEAAWNFMQNVIQGWVNIINGAVATANNILGSIVGTVVWVRDTFIGVWDAIAGFFEGIVERIIRGANRIINAVKNAANAAKNAVPDITPWSGLTPDLNPFASGGPVMGRSGEAIPILAHGGEYVIREDAAKRIGLATLTRLNQLGAGAFDPNSRFSVRKVAQVGVGSIEREIVPGTGGNNINLEVYNPAPEPASDTLQRRLHTLAALGIFGDK